MYNQSKLLFAALIGSFLVWYDFALVGAFAYILSDLFFPEDTRIVALLKIFSVFSVGFIARPLGAIILGRMGDIYGRKNTLALSLILVSTATFAMGLLPTYQSIGIWSSFFLVLLRLIQGFGAGGEHAGGILLLYETSSNHNRIFRTSLSVLGVMAGMFFGFSLSALLMLWFGYDKLLQGAWKIPFLLGGILGCFGLYVRCVIKLPKNDILEPNIKSPLQSLMMHNKGRLLLAIGLYWHSVAIFYATYFYMPSYIAQTKSELASTVMLVRSVAMFAFLLIFFVISWFSDRIGALNMMRGSAIGALILSFPLILCMNSDSIVVYTVGLGIFTLLNIVYLVPLGAVLSHLFPISIRYTGISISINLTSALLGGTTPVIMAMITKIAGNGYYAAGYLILAAFIATLCLYSNRVCKGGPT